MRKISRAITVAAFAATNYRKLKPGHKQHFFCAAILALALAATVPLAQAQTFNVVHEFTGGVDGALPEAALVGDAAGNFYGTTFAGGTAGEGTVYKIESTGEEKILFTFSNSNGSFPASALIQDQAGNLYGTADEGPGGAGIVFKLSPQGEQTVLHAFQGGLDRNPRVPSGGLLMDKAGNIYGATVFGGNGSCQFGCGTIYRLDSAGSLHVLHQFSGGADGSKPFGGLSQDAAGNLYGVAQSGGNLSCPEFPASGCGTVFRLAKNGMFKVLHTFQGGQDGATPQPGLLLDATTGNLFGVAADGGNSENGTVFRIASDGKYTVLHRFSGKDGSAPNGGLVSDSVGNLFGTTQVGGTAGLGTVFVLTPAGRLKVLHAFTGDLDGASPLAGVIRDAAGHLFGTAVKNFLLDQRDGDVFEIAQ
jgi:uncharacterized repeat protein (TIGR03803 family)